MTPALRIRALRPADDEALGRLLEENGAAGAAPFFHPFPLTRDTARGLLRRPGADRYLGAWVGGRLVGFAMLRGWDAGFVIPSFGILLDGPFRRRGIGTRLTRHALRVAGAAGCRAVRLTVHAGNHAARRLFDRAGFVEVSRQPTAGSGATPEALVMIRETPPSAAPAPGRGGRRRAPRR